MCNLSCGGDRRGATAKRQRISANFLDKIGFQCLYTRWKQVAATGVCEKIENFLEDRSHFRFFWRYTRWAKSVAGDRDREKVMIFFGKTLPLLIFLLIYLMGKIGRRAMETAKKWRFFENRSPFSILLTDIPYVQNCSRVGGDAKKWRFFSEPSIGF